MSSSDQIEEARQAFEKGDFRQSLTLLSPLMIESHEDGQVLLMAAQCHSQLKESSKAVTLYRKLAEVQPAAAAMFIQMAEKLEAAAPQVPGSQPGLSQEAALSLVTTADRRGPIFQQMLAAFEAGDHETVVQTFDTVQQQSHLINAGMLTLLAVSYEHLGDLEKATHYLGHAARLPGLNQTALLRAAFSHFEQLFTDKGLIPDLAIDITRSLVEREPENVAATRYYRFALQAMCAIDNLRAINEKSLKGLKAGLENFRKSEDLHSHLCWCADEAINASIDTGATHTPFTEVMREARRRQPHVFKEKIRIGYLTSDLYAEHPTSLLIKGVFAAHDPTKFDVTLYCFANRKFSDADRAFRRTLPNLVTIGHLDTQSACNVIRQRGIDILIDLKGPTSDSWPDLVNAGPAPIQAAWLGFPGSGNGIDCDYIISDPVVTPDSSRPHYHEKLCRLPETYQCNDAFTRPQPQGRSKAEMGIAPDTFLFASFNGMNKLSPQIVDLWAAILLRVEDAKLALFCSNDRQKANFLAAMQRHGLGPERFIFWPRAAYEDHLARIPAADLGLDCYPYNGHTTTSDMLWMGLPLVTFKGSNFASRVSESLLKAIGLPDLVAEDPQGFVELAVRLASDPARLAEIRQRIHGNRFNAPLFDTERFTRHLERAYEMMVERHRGSLEPDHFVVPALPPRERPFR